VHVWVWVGGYVYIRGVVKMCACACLSVRDSSLCVIIATCSFSLQLHVWQTLYHAQCMSTRHTCSLYHAQCMSTKHTCSLYHAQCMSATHTCSLYHAQCMSTRHTCSLYHAQCMSATHTCSLYHATMYEHDALSRTCFHCITMAIVSLTCSSLYISYVLMAAAFHGPQ